MREFGFVVGVLLFVLLGELHSEKCPLKCQCLWRNSKITADCTNRDLSSIPGDIEHNTQVLNVSGNDISALVRSQFSKLGLNNLQRVSASGVGLSRIDDLAFTGLTNLVELELADNEIHEVPKKSLSEVPGLMSLSLRNNPIRQIRVDAFSALSQLSKLDLSECRIEVIDEGSFVNLKDLQRLYLHANRIRALSPTNTLPPSLHGISLHDNRWECDCRLRDFRHWLTKSHYVPRPVEPACIGPRRLLGIRIQSLSLTEFACRPQLSPTSMFLTVPYGKNVSILCKVAADPITDIRWFFNGKKLFSNPYERSYGDHKRKVISERGKLSTARSELVIFNTDAGDNGTYYCKARNKAGESTSNFTLKVANPVVASPRILKLPLEYFVGVAIAIMIILVLVSATVGILLIRVCRQRLEIRAVTRHHATGGESIIVSSATTDLKKINESSKIGGILISGRKNGTTNKIGPNMSCSKMPRYIQMGTGFSVSGSDSSSPTQQQQQQPDLIKPGFVIPSSNKSLSESSSQGSYRLAMENIIDEYRQTSEDQHPQESNHRSIRESGVASSLLCGNSSRGFPCISGGNQSSSLMRHSQEYFKREPISLPADYGLPHPSTSSSLQQLQPYSLMYMDQLSYLNRRPMRPDEMYPDMNYSQSLRAQRYSLYSDTSSLTRKATVETQTSKEEIGGNGDRGSPDGSKTSGDGIEGSSGAKESAVFESQKIAMKSFVSVENDKAECAVVETNIDDDKDDSNLSNTDGKNKDTSMES